MPGVTTPDPKPELIGLHNLQLAALEKEAFGVVTERREYWRRHDRIHKLYRQLDGISRLETASEHSNNVEVIPRRTTSTRAA